MAYEAKTKATDADVGAFLQSVEHAGRREDAYILLDLMTRVTGADPVMWGSSIVGFGHYDYRYESGHSGRFMRTGFSPRKANMVVYILPGYSDFTDELSRLGPHKMGKSCLYLGRLAKIDLNVLEEMIRRGWAEMARRYPDTD